MKPNILRKRWSDYKNGLVTEGDIFGGLVDSICIDQYPTLIDSMPNEMLVCFRDYIGSNTDSRAHSVSQVRLEAVDFDFQVAFEKLTDKVCAIRCLIKPNN